MQIDGLIFFIFSIGIGYILAKRNVLPSSAADTLSSVLMNVCYPAMILDTFFSTDIDTLIHTGIPIVLTSASITLCLFFLSLLVFRKRPKAQKPLLTFITGIGNVTFVAIPLMSIFLSKEALLIALLHGTVQDFIIWTLYHQLFIQQSISSKERPVKKKLINPCLIASVIGLLSVLFSLPIPSWISTVISNLNIPTAPLALLLLGALINQYGVFSWLHDRTAIIYAILKTIAFPAILYPPLSLIFSPYNALTLSIALGAPAPLTSVIWSKQYGADAKLAVNCVIASTLLYILADSVTLLVLTQLGYL